MKTLIENAIVLTMDDEMRVFDRGYVLTDGANIAEVGAGRFAGDADERIDARGGILLPGFVNTHCHVSMVPFRTMGDDCPDRLRRFLFPLENEAMTRELVYRGAVFGIGEMLLAGVTTFVDMYYFEDEVARACVRTGMRGYLGETLISQPTCDSAQPGGGLEIARRMFDTWRGEALVRPIVAPHGTTTCNEALLRAGVELAAGQNALFTLHASEMDYEMKYLRRTGETPTRYLKQIGAVNERLLAGHCIHLTHGRISRFWRRETRRLRTASAATRKREKAWPRWRRRRARAFVSALVRTARPPATRSACLTRCACLRMRIRRRTATARFSRQKKLCARRRGAARKLCTPGTNWGSSVPVCGRIWCWSAWMRRTCSRSITPIRRWFTAQIVRM